MRLYILKKLKQDKIIWLTALTNWASKAITIGINLLTIRISSSYFSQQEYALFVLLISLQSWTIVADLGLGSSLQNYVAEKRTHKQAYDAFISTAYFVLLLLVFLLSLIAFLGKDSIGVAYLQSILINNEQKGQIWFYSFCILVFTFAFETAYKITYAEGVGYQGIIAYTVGRLIGFLTLLLVFSYFKNVSVFTISLVYLLPSAIVAFAFFTQKLSSLSTITFSGIVARTLVKRGFLFFLFTIALYLPFFTEYIVISKYLQAYSVVQYNFMKRLYEIPSYMYNAILLALWSLFTEKYLQKRFKEISTKIFKNILIGILGMTIAIGLLSWQMPLALKILAPDLDIYIPSTLTAYFGVYFLLRVFIDTFSAFLQSINQTLVLIWVYTFTGILSIVLEFWLTPKYQLYGLATALILPMCIVAIILPVYSLKLLHKKNDQDIY